MDRVARSLVPYSCSLNEDGVGSIDYIDASEYSRRAMDSLQRGSNFGLSKNIDISPSPLAELYRLDVCQYSEE